MLFNFFRKKNKSPSEGSGNPYGLLVKFLVAQVSSPLDAKAIIDEAQRFLKYSDEKKLDEVVRIYLLFQQFCTRVDEIQRVSKKAFQRKTIGQFSWLQLNEVARIPFKGDKEAEILLATYYLNQVLSRATEITGSGKDSSMGPYQSLLDTIWREDYKSAEDILHFKKGKSISFKDLVKLSQQIYHDLGERLGEGTAANLFQKVYARTEYLFKDFDLFPCVIELMPVQILMPEHLRILGQNQIHKILTGQVNELGDLNEKLVYEAKENEALTQVLKNRTDALESILSNALDAVVQIDEKGRVTYWNTKAQDTFGYTQKEAIGAMLGDLIEPDVHKEGHSKGMARFVSESVSKILDQNIEIEAVHKDGHQFPVELSITQVKDNNQYSFIGFIRDISQRKEYEATLIKAKEHAEETSRFKSRFFANMSHEIRTPLNAIIGFTEVLLGQNLNEEQKEYLNLIETSGNNLMTILNDILELSKIEEGKLQLNAKPEEFENTVTQMLSPYEAIASEKGLSYELSFQEGFPKVIALDYHRLGQILVNLISNALKFTTKGSIRAHFAYHFNELGKPVLTATVSDTGKGILEENLSKIFDSFQQEDGSIAREFGGTGLGLSISKEIAAAMGGSLSATSPSKVFDQGSDFIAVVEGELGSLPSKRDILAEEKADFSSKGISALLVEDNLVNQKLLSTILQQMGLATEPAINGLEAIEKLENQNFDIIFMDIQMPELDGYSAAERIRKMGIKTPIIAISANVYPEDVQKSISSGMQMHIGKPFNMDELKEVIAKWASPKL